jgi:SAM-dependent methyltransferase
MTAAERRLSFGGVAQLYEEARPGYPEALVDEVLDYARLGAGEPVLEVGAGTGKATRQFAARGQQIVALEPSAEMAAVARVACRGLANVTLIEAEFEAWPLPPTRFGLVFSAQAWHWIDPAVRYVKARAALRAGGALAAFWSHADWSGNPLHAELQAAYRQAAPGFEPSGPMHPAARRGDLVPDWEAEIEAAAALEAAEVREFRWRQRYSARDYVRLLATHSDHAVLEPATRERLLGAVRATIERRGGELEVLYVTRLCLARAV